MFLIPYLASSTGSAERAGAPQTSARSSAHTSVLPAEPPQCGPLSLYVFLRLVGADVTSERTHAAVPNYNNATHLQALKAAASSFGIDAEIRKTTGSTPSGSELPAIVYVRAPRLRTSDVGHFVVLVGVDSSGVEFIDPVTAELKECPVDEFFESWTGYYLTRTVSGNSRGNLVAAMSLSALCGLALYSRFWRKAVVRIAFIAGAAFSSGIATAAEPPIENEELCIEGVRSPLSDAPNCAYLFAALNESDVPYDEWKAAFGDRQRGVSMRQLAEILRQHALPVEILRLSPTELARIQFPAIILLDDSVAEGSRYAVLTDMTPERATVIEGGMAVLTQYSMDDFRRIWTGYTLLRRRRPRSGSLALSGAAALILTIMGAVFLVSSGRRSATTS